MCLFMNYWVLIEVARPLLLCPKIMWLGRGLLCLLPLPLFEYYSPGEIAPQALRFGAVRPLVTMARCSKSHHCRARQGSFRSRWRDALVTHQRWRSTRRRSRQECFLGDHLQSLIIITLEHGALTEATFNMVRHVCMFTFLLLPGIAGFHCCNSGN